MEIQFQKRAGGVKGAGGGEEKKESKQKEPKNWSGGDELQRVIANPEGLRRDNDLQLPAVLFSILDKSKGNEEEGEEEEGLGGCRGGDIRGGERKTHTNGERRRSKDGEEIKRRNRSPSIHPSGADSSSPGLSS